MAVGTRWDALLWMSLSACTGADVRADSATVPTAVAPEWCVALGDPPENVRYVDPGAAAGGDGSPSAPFATATDALLAAEPGQELRLAPGNYEEGVAIDDPVRHRGLSVRACVPGETVIRGIVSVAGTTDAALFDVTVADLTAELFSLSGSSGTRIEGASVATTVSESALAVSQADAVITGSFVAASSGDGSAAVALDYGDLSVNGSLAVTGWNYGIDMESGSQLDVVGDVSVSASTDIAVVVDWSAVRVTGALMVSGAAGHGLVAGGTTADLTIEPGAVLSVLDAGGVGLAIIDGATAYLDGTIEVQRASGVGIWVEGTGSSLGCEPASTLLVDDATEHAVVAYLGGNVELCNARVSSPGAAVFAEGGSIAMSGVSTLAGGTYGIVASIEEDSGTPGDVRVEGDVTIATGESEGVSVDGSTFVLAGTLTVEGHPVAARIGGGGTWEAEPESWLTSTEPLYGAVHVLPGGLARLGAVDADHPGEYGVWAQGEVELLDEFQVTDPGIMGAYVSDGGLLNLTGALSVERPGEDGVVVGDAGSTFLAGTGSLVDVTDSANFGISVDPAGTATLGPTRIAVPASAGIWVDDGSSLSIPAGVDVTIEDAGAAGLFASDGSSATLGGRLTISSPSSSGLAAVNGATIEILSGGSATVTSPSGDGIYVDAATFRSRGNVTVMDATAPAIAAIDGATLDIVGATVEGGSYAAVYALDSSVLLDSVTILGVGSPRGDGIYIARPVGTVSLANLEVHDNDRAAILVDGGTGTVVGATVSGNAWSLIHQDCEVPLEVAGLVASDNVDDGVHLCDGTTLEPPL